MAKFVTLYSGSSGNCAVIEQDGRVLLVDIGHSCRATLAALQQVGLSPRDISGILITHEHSDHISGLEVFLRKVPVPVFASAATLDVLWQRDHVPAAAELVAVDGRETDVDGFCVVGFPTSHDAAGCCGFRVTSPAGHSMAIATDLGEITEPVFKNLQNASLVALEANYDPDMLRTGPYPAYLKNRISSSRGHLSNQDCASALTALIVGGCNQVALCHLSQENNHPDHALAALEGAFRAIGRDIPGECTVQVSPRHTPGEWMNF